MKKSLTLFLSLFIILFFSSCRKNYTCTCKFVFTGGDYTTITQAKSTKKDAEAWCGALQSSNAQPGVLTTCVLK